MGKKEEIGRRIRTMRKSRNMTQEDLARAIDQSPSSITMYETGRREPDLETLEALADVFNVSLASIVSCGSDESAEAIEEADREFLESLHRDPELRMLFDRARHIPHDDVVLVRQFVEHLKKLRDGDE